MPYNGLGRACFDLVHRHQLVYNTCWEDPRIDREALQLGADDVVVMITSAGCNALDYALDEPRHIYAIDLNARQNALLDLKQAAIRSLEYDEFFALFGRGSLASWPAVYRTRVRSGLGEASRAYWDRHVHYFSGSRWRPSFYFHGTTGLVARVMNAYLARVARVRRDLDDLLDAPSIDHQREIYERRQLRQRLWNPLLNWALGRDAVLSLLAVPQTQREHLERDYPGGVPAFVRNAIETVLTRLPIADNYFWRVYLTGAYSPDCCPEYLKRDNFLRLKAGLVDRVTTHTSSLMTFMRSRPAAVTRFVLLDHMDWLCDQPAVLATEWRHLLDCAAPGAKVLWRSGGQHTRFVDSLRIAADGGEIRLGSRLRYDRALAARLHAVDRVHTYGSFHIAEVAA